MESRFESLRSEALVYFGISEQAEVPADIAARIQDYIAMRIRQLSQPKPKPKAHQISSFLPCLFTGRTESPIEEVLENAIAKSKEIGFFKKQLKVGPYHLDFAIPHVKLGIEADGRAYHSDPAQISRDQSRDAYLTRLGWTILRFSGSKIRRSSDECVRRIEKVLRTLVQR